MVPVLTSKNTLSSHESPDLVDKMQGVGSGAHSRKSLDLSLFVSSHTVTIEVSCLFA